MLFPLWYAPFFSLYSLIVKCVITIITSGSYVVVLTGETKGLKMGRGVSSGGGQSSLGYLFGGGEPANNVQASKKPNGSSQPTSSTSQPADKHIPAGIPGNHTNNYHRADGQNCGNFITVGSLFSCWIEMFCADSYSPTILTFHCHIYNTVTVTVKAHR